MNPIYILRKRENWWPWSVANVWRCLCIQYKLTDISDPNDQLTLLEKYTAWIAEKSAFRLHGHTIRLIVCVRVLSVRIFRYMCVPLSLSLWHKLTVSEWVCRWMSTTKIDVTNILCCAIRQIRHSNPIFDCMWRQCVRFVAIWINYHWHNRDKRWIKTKERTRVRVKKLKQFRHRHPPTSPSSSSLLNIAKKKQHPAEN